MTNKRDKMLVLDTCDKRRAACGYTVSYTTCANCCYCAHQRHFCDLHFFPVNIDRGTCRNFAPHTRGAGPSRPAQKGKN